MSGMQNANGIAELERINYITVYPAPAVNFTADIRLTCAPATIRFSDLSTTTVGSITAWDWDFGDGASSTLANPSHVFASTGTYAVKLTLTDKDGGTSQATFSTKVLANAIVANAGVGRR